MNQCFQIDVDILLVLSAGIIDKNLNISHFRKLTTHIALKMNVVVTDKRSLLSVDSHYRMSLLKEEFRDGLSDAL